MNSFYQHGRMPDSPAMTVTQLNTYLKEQIDHDAFLGSVCVRGEISNYKAHSNGHHYFTLKDADSALSCIMFKWSATSLRFRPENGMQVLATGQVKVYLRGGSYQLVCTSMTPDGLGNLYLAFEQLKQKLQAEGLFEESRKKPLPQYPHTIAIITAATGAAVHDMLRILGKRYPLSKVKLLSVHVQGERAPAEIAGALRYVNRLQLADVIICGRGGGSIEDLWAFNDERVARAIAASEIPVVSAVGHEPDVTIADFVADVRAATPSNAAEIVAPDRDELQLHLDSLQDHMTAALVKKLQDCRQRLEALRSSAVLQGPDAFVNLRRQQLLLQQQALGHAMRALLDAQELRVSRSAASLDALSPLKVLGRGYTLLLRNGEVIRSARQVAPGDRLTVRMSDGLLRVTAEETEIMDETERRGAAQ